MTYGATSPAEHRSNAEVQLVGYARDLSAEPSFRVAPDVPSFQTLFHPVRCANPVRLLSALEAFSARVPVG